MTAEELMSKAFTYEQLSAKLGFSVEQVQVFAQDDSGNMLLSIQDWYGHNLVNIEADFDMSTGKLYSCKILRDLR